VGINLLLATTGALETGQPDDAFNTGVAAPSALSVFAFYGPAYFVLSHLVWRNLSGDRLRTALRRTAVPQNSLVRSFLVGSPTQIASGAAMLSLAAVWIVAIRPGAPLAMLLISLACVCGSWILLMSTFSVEYAREWAESDGFTFPGDEDLAYSDFVYLSVQASTGYSAADVSTTTRRARNLITIHAVTAFIFATVILAFLVALVLNTISG
jgi:uncharacterized membrane protein